MSIKPQVKSNPLVGGPPSKKKKTGKTGGKPEAFLQDPTKDSVMPRHPRPLVDGGCYHLIARGNNRQWLFAEPADFERFLDGLATTKRRGQALSMFSIR